MFAPKRNAMRLLTALAASLLLVSCGGNDTPEPAPLFSKVYAFGASTSDNGNACNLAPKDYCPPSPPYAGPRLSNGLLFDELLAARYGATLTPSRFGGTNFAYSGARTGPIAGVTHIVPNMVAQLDQYLALVNYQSNPQYLYIVDGVAFGNDIKDAFSLSATDPNAPTKVLTAAVTNVVTILNRLAASGARYILLTTSTDVGKTPYVQAAGAATAAAATQLSLTFNGALAQQLPAIRATFPDLQLYVLDVAAFAAQAAANPGAFGYTNVTQACFNDLLPVPTPCSTPGTFFYWDTFHGTATTNNHLYQRAVTLLGR
jgi:outer membrane lipase/esterase